MIKLATAAVAQQQDLSVNDVIILVALCALSGFIYWVGSRRDK